MRATLPARAKSATRNPRERRRTALPNIGNPQSRARVSAARLSSRRTRA